MEPSCPGLVTAGPGVPVDDEPPGHEPGGQRSEQSFDLRDGQRDHTGFGGRWLVGPDRGRRLGAGAVLELASWAQQLAQALLQDPLPRRWAHVQGVATRARGLASVLVADADLLEAAAWLYDIGYAPSLAATGLHQLDGARYLRDAQHADAMLCRLVAHHSCAIIEAGERGLANVLSAEFDPAPDVLASVLTCCDMTTSPDGQPVRVERRLAEIHARYGPGDLVSRSIQHATPMILRAVEQVHQRAAQTT
jgi:hypothetical protein